MFLQSQGDCYKIRQNKLLFKFILFCRIGKAEIGQVGILISVIILKNLKLLPKLTIDCEEVWFYACLKI